MVAPPAVAVRASVRTHSAGSRAPSASTTAARRYQRLSRSGSASRSIRQRMPASAMAVTAPVSASTSSSAASHTLPVVRHRLGARRPRARASACRSWPTRSAGAGPPRCRVRPGRSDCRIPARCRWRQTRRFVRWLPRPPRALPAPPRSVPAVASLSAHAHPVTPAPTTSTSAARSPATEGYAVGSPCCCHSDGSLIGARRLSPLPESDGDHHRRAGAGRAADRL